jgi:hypothetical protein
MKEIYISLSRKDVLRNWEWKHDEENQENGSRELHIFPDQIAYYEVGSKDKPHHMKFQFVQTGNSYGPNFDYSKISIYGIDDIFDESDSYFNELDFNYSETRYEARKEWSETNNIDFEIVEENHLDENWEYYQAVSNIEDVWVQNHVGYNQDIAISAMKDELVDEEKGVVYKIVWEE